MKIKKKIKKSINTKLERKIKQAWKESTSIPRPCCLCEKITMDRGIFMPKNARPFGASESQEGAFIYPICSDCYSLPHDKIFPLIKQTIFSSMKRRSAGLN